MKYFNNVKNLNELRKEYKKLIRQYHPDNGGNESITKVINNEYEIMFNRLKKAAMNSNEKTYDNFDINIDIELRKILNSIINLNVDIEIIGCWIWVTGNTLPVKNILKGFNFKWSSKKTAWYFHNDNYKKISKKIFSLNEIREMYGTKQIKTANKENEKQIAMV